MEHSQPNYQKLLDEFAFIDEQTFADLVGVDPATCKAWRYRGTSPAFISVGSRVFYSKETVKQWLLSKAIGNTSPFTNDEL
jgi:hypothetical protein